MYQGMCKDVLQVCGDAGIVINIPVMSKTAPFIRTVVLASVGAHMDDTVQENVTRGVRETRLRYEKGFKQSHIMWFIRHVVGQIQTQSMGLASLYLAHLQP